MTQSQWKSQLPTTYVVVRITYIRIDVFSWFCAIGQPQGNGIVCNAMCVNIFHLESWIAARARTDGSLLLKKKMGKIWCIKNRNDQNIDDEKWSAHLQQLHFCQFRFFLSVSSSFLIVVAVGVHSIESIEISIFFFTSHHSIVIQFIAIQFVRCSSDECKIRDVAAYSSFKYKKKISVKITNHVASTRSESNADCRCNNFFFWLFLFCRAAQNAFLLGNEWTNKRIDCLLVIHSFTPHLACIHVFECASKRQNVVS